MRGRRKTLRCSAVGKRISRMSDARWGSGKRYWRSLEPLSARGCS
jgi:hypothetical protein